MKRNGLELPPLWLGLTLVIFFSVLASAQAKWIARKPFPDPSEELLGATANGKLYAFAGLGEQWTPKGLVYEYDPATDTWTKKRPMPLPSHHVAFTSYNGKIYAFGGFKPPDSGPPGWQPLDNSWEYDPATDTWKALAPMPGKRGAAAAAAVNGKIYVIGGATPQPHSQETVLRPGSLNRAVPTVEEYDIASNTWRERTPMPTARNHLAVAAVNGKIYAIGGRLSTAFIGLASDTDVVEEYDPATDSWGATRARMPTPRSAMSWGVYNGKIYVAGGEFQDARQSAAFRAVEAYDPATNTWSVLPSMPVGRHGMAGGIVGDTMYLVSGDVQSSGTGVPMHTAESDALKLSDLR